MEKNKQKGPSLSALAALTTLAIALWLQVDLATALFRSILVYLTFSLMLMAYRVILGRFLAISQARAEQELLDKIQREAEEEEAQKRERQELEKEKISLTKSNDAASREKSSVNKKIEKQKEVAEA